MTSLTGSYNIRPQNDVKFKPNAVKQVINYVLNEELRTREYDEHNASDLAKELSKIILHKLKEMNFDRYKFVVNVFIGEQRGQGIKMTNKCFWDCDTDGQVFETIVTDSLICTASVYAIYYY